MEQMKMVQNRKIRSNITKLYFYWFFHAFIFAYVIERLYWAERGMSVQYVVYVEIIYAIVIALLEVPSGYISDRWNRKWMMVIGAFFTFLEFFILIFAHTFWHFVIAILFAAMQGAISSGTSNALLYDSLKTIGKVDQFEKILGRVRFFKYAAAMTAALVGSGVASEFGLVSNYWLSLGSVTIAFLISLTLVEPTIRTEEETEDGSKNYVKMAFQFLRDHRSIQFVLFYGIVLGSFLVYLEEFWQLYVESVGIAVIFFGIVSATIMGTGSVSGLIAHRIKARFTYRSIFTLLLLCFSSGLILMSVLQNMLGLVFMWIAFAVAGVAEPLLSGYLHHRTASMYRATVESFYSLASRVAVAVVGLLFGAIEKYFGIHGAFMSLGILSLLYFLIFTSRAKEEIEESLLVKEGSSGDS